jgi:hypothetical protein
MTKSQPQPKTPSEVIEEREQRMKSAAAARIEVIDQRGALMSLVQASQFS